MLCQGLRYQGSARPTHVFGDWRPTPTDLQVDDTPFELTCLSESTSGGQKERELARKWLFLVQLFSNCCLSYEEDTLPALSGLALIFQRFTQDHYIAGIWKKSLLQGLLWARSPNVTPRYPKKYRAPSWSWAAMSCKIYFPLLNDLHGMIYEDIWVAEVIEASVQTDGPDQMGRVVSGFICLSSNLRQTRDMLWTKEGASGRVHIDWIDGSAPTSGSIVSNNVFHLLLGYRIKRQDKGPQEIIDVHGLIVEQVTECRFRRLGAFQHGWHKEGLDDTGRLPLFVDFNPHDLKRTRVILI
ncbi:hypothetical protein HBI17_028970 [Parastagonospora nodorum]|nr:hypothetical protein HBH49_038220 [Parastagonospora nodorum]KAH5282174.1 hypothetical protein HBI71_000380 [Parastagonospora nodorum]KAH5390159.1 hypothetical protein HBI33_022620 [Parastagonospora nodorum]KAH5425040.1 hypothetical protein HBI47_121700 [Parastagonospora nodorum]KAH5721196.1 hypothetical protein HBI20_099690 [Parastagonospora nodorum]